MGHLVLLENILASEDLSISLHYSKLSRNTSYLNAPVETRLLLWELQSYDINTPLIRNVNLYIKFMYNICHDNSLLL